MSATGLRPDDVANGRRGGGLLGRFQENAFEALLDARVKVGWLAVRGGWADEEMDAALAVPPVAPEAGTPPVAGPRWGARPEAFGLEMQGDQAVRSSQARVPGVAIGGQADEANVLLGSGVEGAPLTNVGPG